MGPVDETAPRGLTKLSFRRDVKLFFTVLSGFFIVLVTILLILLQQAQRTVHESTWRYWNAVADAAAAQADGAVALHRGIDPAVLLTFIRGRHGVTWAELELRDGRRASDGVTGGGETEAIARTGEWGRLTLHFDASALVWSNRTLRATTAVTLAAALTAVVLVLLYIPRITRPIERLLDEAGEVESRDPGVDEHEYLIETFRKSMATLKAQQQELHALHNAQKSRADDFERVTTALMRGLTSGLIAVAADGRIAQLNDAAREVLHLTDAIIGRDFAEALGGGGFTGVLRDALTRRAPLTRLETTYVPHGGPPLIIGVTTVPLLSDAGELLGMLALFTDLTSIRALEQRVREMQTLADLGEMSAGIAHEFRNSLSTILGYLKLAHRQQLPEEAAARLRCAEEEAAQLSDAVASLLTFARPMAIQPQECDLRELVESVVRRLEASAPGVRFTIDGDATVQGDPALLSRAFENVIRNAVESVRAQHHANGSGEVAVAIDAARRAVTVRDNGVGLDAESAGRWFLPFQSNKPDGFGLGLALTRKIVLLHGGTITLTGAPGQGALVEMQLGQPLANTR